MDKARKAALDALDFVFKNNSYSNIAIESVFKSSKLSSLDRSFASALFYGVLDRKITLDYYISGYLKKGIEKTPLTVVNAIRMAVYQILYMDKVPESAAVNESVNLVKSSKYGFSASLVNGVLRNFLRNEKSLPEDDSLPSLSVRFSCPEYIINGFIRDYGLKTAVELLEESLKAPPVFLRANTLKCSAEELISKLKEEDISAVSSDFDAALKISSGTDLISSECFKSGMFHIEDLACQIAVSYLKVMPGERVLDMCSAPGGKAFTMAEYMENRGEIVACDIYESRVELIKQGAERLGINIIKPIVFNSAESGDLGLFDAILCDVPCSGTGVIRRKPEIKYKPENDYEELSDIQFSILSNADNFLKPGGRILYSTCTLSKSENTGVVSRFLDKFTSYRLEYEHTFMPQTDKTDGFYCALIKKSR